MLNIQMLHRKPWTCSAANTYMIGAHLGVGGVEDLHELVHAPVEPAHEEHTQRQAVRD